MYIAVTLLEYKEKFIKEQAVVLKVKVFPAAGRTDYIKTLGDGTLKIAVKAVPEKGKANRELVRYLATFFGVPSEQVAIMRGLEQRLKLVKIEA